MHLYKGQGILISVLCQRSLLTYPRDPHLSSVPAILTEKASDPNLIHYSVTQEILTSVKCQGSSLTYSWGPHLNDVPGILTQLPNGSSSQSCAKDPYSLTQGILISVCPGPGILSLYLFN